MEKENYNEILQSYIDKIKTLKEWLHSSDDNETKEYLQLEINKKLEEMKKITVKKGG